jgi:predicted regulator of Ras-like GTPase activity (Roadblock/LC7/MglB family)
MTEKNTETDETENQLEELQQKLQELKDQEVILGSILRGAKTASIDLKDPRKLIDYAILSSTAFEESQNMTETLQMGEPKKILLESEDTKLLAMNVNNHRLSIFMEKSVNHNKLYKNLK